MVQVEVVATVRWMIYVKAIDISKTLPSYSSGIWINSFVPNFAVERLLALLKLDKNFIVQCIMREIEKWPLPILEHSKFGIKRKFLTVENRKWAL